MLPSWLVKGPRLLIQTWDQHVEMTQNNINGCMSERSFWSPGTLLKRIFLDLTVQPRRGFVGEYIPNYTPIQLVIFEGEISGSLVSSSDNMTHQCEGQTSVRDSWQDVCQRCKPPAAGFVVWSLWLIEQHFVSDLCVSQTHHNHRKKFAAVSLICLLAFCTHCYWNVWTHRTTACSHSTAMIFKIYSS